MRSPPCTAAMRSDAPQRRLRARTMSASLLAVASNGMLPGLIVLAPSALFSFNRDHYPPGVHSPTCRARARSRRSKVHGARMHTRCEVFFDLTHRALTHVGCLLTYLGQACLYIGVCVCVFSRCGFSRHVRVLKRD